MSTHGHPVIDAAWRELCAIHAETGGGNGLRPNKSSEYKAAHRVFVAALEAHRAIVCERTSVRIRKTKLKIV
jgi:hypothetical protein